jgi:hypothetical protein
LDGFIAFFQEVLQRNGIRSADLAAIASVGGGASIPMVTTTLSEQLRVPVITTPRPHLTAAVGAALRAARGPADSETALAPTAAGSVADATTISDVAVEPSPAPALAWSEANDDSGIMPIRAGEYPEQASNAALTSARPKASVDRAPQPGVSGAVADAWYRRPVVVAVGTALAVLAVGAAVMITLRHTSGGTPSTPAPSVSTAPAPASSAPANQNPGSSDATDTQAPASSPPSSTEPPSTTSETPIATTTTEVPTTTTPTQVSTTTHAPEPPVGPRFPRGPAGPRVFPQPEPGYR